MLHIVIRDVRGCTNYICIQLCITSTCKPCFEGRCVCFSQSGSSIAVLRNLEDTRFTHVSNYVFLFIADNRTISVIASHLKFNFTTSAVRSSRVLVRSSHAYLMSGNYILPIQILNRLHDCFLFKCVLLHHI